MSSVRIIVLALSVAFIAACGGGQTVTPSSASPAPIASATASARSSFKDNARAIVRTNSVVHINSELPAGRVVPEGWTAIGRPAEVVPPGEDEQMLFSLYGMNFTKAVFGGSRAEVGMKNYLDLFGAHRGDGPIR